MKSRVLMLSVIVALLVATAAGQVAPYVPLPADLNGELDGVAFRIRVPANWNGTLLVYAHGYAEGATPPLLAPSDADVTSLLAGGYALAASRFAGAGFNIKEGMQNTLALTSAFRDMIGRPKRTILWGKSLGGLMTLGMIEKFANHYDGAVALCPPAAGSPRRWDQALDIAIAYAAAFGWLPEWGTPGDIRDDLNFTTEVQPHIVSQLIPAKKGFWEFIRRVNKLPPDTYYQGMNRVMPVYFAIGVRAELESRAGGPVAENMDRVYSLTDADKSALAALGITAQMADSMLAQMNASRFTFDRNARNYVEHYVDPTGWITRPVITLHTTGDALATLNHEGAYRDRVEAAGRSELLMQQFVPGGTHCTFTSAQEIASIDAMMSWLQDGNRPDSMSFFTTAKGFDPTVVPDSWPW